ncbi:MAG: RCC1 domain-containing protein [Polyangiales bacterium]
MDCLPPARSSATRRDWCALARDGQVWCWGGNSDGELGLDDAPRPDVWTPVMTLATRPATTR